MKFSFGSSLQTSHPEEKSLLRSLSLTYMFWPFLTLMLPHQACTWKKEWIWGTSENFPRSYHLNAQNIKSPKEDARLNATKGKAVIRFHKTNTTFSMLLVCNSGNFATVQWSKKWSQFVCFRNSSIVSSKNARICPDHLAPTTLVQLLNSYALPLLWHQFV